jgi:hypothetical protein
VAFPRLDLDICTVECETVLCGEDFNRRLLRGEPKTRLAL